MIGHGSLANYEMGKIRSQIEMDWDKEENGEAKDKPKPYVRLGRGKYKVYSAEPGSNGPVMKKMSADEYRKFMGAQGITFGKVVTNG